MCFGGEMRTVILCGGLGTRLREETEFHPKPLVEVGGRPILWHILKLYAHHGHSDFVLCLGYKGNMIKEYFINYEAMNNDFTIGLGESRNNIEYHSTHNEQDFTVTLADTGLGTMTGGRIKRIMKYVKDDTFMATYGDGVADVNIDELIKFHKSHGKIATMTTYPPISRFGVVDVSDDGRIKKFTEKPNLDGWINAGFYVFNKEIFDYLEGDDTVLEKEPLESLAKDGELVAYRHTGFFFPMDTYRDYEQLNEIWDNGKAPWKVWKQ